MQALISGRAGVAILLDGERLTSIGLDPREAPAPRSARDVRFLLGDVRDVEALDDVDLATVRQRLADARTADDALQLALFVLDPALSSGTREDAAGALDELLSRKAMREFVEGVLFARPVPASADLAGARKLAKHAPAVSAMLDELADSRDTIEEVWRAWEALPPSLFRGESDRAAKRAALVRAGTFRQLVGAKQSGLRSAGEVDADPVRRAFVDLVAERAPTIAGPVKVRRQLRPLALPSDAPRPWAA